VDRAEGQGQPREATEVEICENGRGRGMMTAGIRSLKVCRVHGHDPVAGLDGTGGPTISRCRGAILSPRVYLQAHYLVASGLGQSWKIGN
jgi:hypothetical protein